MDMWKRWHKGSHVFRLAQVPARTQKSSLSSHQDGWCQQNFLLGNILFWTWQPVSWVAMVTRGPGGMKNIKGGLETQASPSPPVLPLTLSWWQALTDPHKPREPRTRVLTQYWADKTPHCFQSAITTNIYGTQWGSTSCGLSPLIFPKPYMIYATVIPIYNRWSHREVKRLALMSHS